MKAPLLVIDNLHATYNNTIVALAGISLAVQDGEIVALLGANGAGKTTTLKALSNLLPAERGQITQGQVLWEGRDITKAKTVQIVRDGIVQVLEGRRCFKGLSIEENLITGALNRRGSRASARQGLEKIYALFPQLKEKRNLAAGLASGGQQQMTAVGRALMSNPRLLILDEPSMGLAPLVVESIFGTLKRLNRETGMAILVAEQNSTVAMRYADRAYVIENGAVVLEGTAADLCQRDDIKAFYLGLAKVPGFAKAGCQTRFAEACR